MSEIHVAEVNGSGTPETMIAGSVRQGPIQARNDRMAQNFAQIVAVLMRDTHFKDLMVADLEWLVLPAIVAGQFKIAHAQTAQPNAKAKNGRMFVPVAAVLWARVSPNIDKMLSEKLNEPLRLQPKQWSSGNTTWLMAAAGDKRAVPKFLKQLNEQEFKGGTVKVRMRGVDGSVVVGTLAQHIESISSQS